MQIGYVSSSYWPIIGGMPIFLRQLARAMQAEGATIRIATRFTHRQPASMAELLTTQEPGREYTEDGILIKVLHARGLHTWLFPVAYRTHFREKLDRLAQHIFTEAFLPELDAFLHTVDVIHLSGTGRELLGFAALRLARRQGIPFFVTPHIHIGIWGDSELDLRLYREADGIFALTHVEKDHLARLGIPEERITVTGNGINVTGEGSSSWKDRHRIEGPLILFLGRKASYKGFHRLLNILPEVWKYRPDAHIVFAGPDETDTWRTLTPRQRATLEDKRVLNLPPVSEEEKEDLLASCDICCVPSEAEAFGMVYLEAWYYRKPTVGLRIPTLVELFGRSGGGLLARNERELTMALLRLLGNERERLLLGNSGFAFARAFTWPRIARHTLDSYRKVLNRTLRTPHVSAA